MDIEKFSKDMAVFSFSQHQNVLTYLAHLEAKGWTIKAAREWVTGERERLTQQQNEYMTAVKQCPICQASMSLLPLNFNRATVTGEDSQSVWFCSNHKCLNTIYNKESVKELCSEGGT